MIKNLDHLLNEIGKMPKRTVAIAAAEDMEILEVAAESYKRNIAEFILLGNQREIENKIEKGKLEIGSPLIIDCKNEQEAALKSMELVREGKANLPMKGFLQTATFMKAVLDKDVGLRTSKLISQISVTDKINGEGLYFITDCAMNVNPNLDGKKHIIENAVTLATKFGYSCPKVALLAAVETVNESMAETLDAAILSKMCERKQIKNCIIDGPLALDNAISHQSAAHKGINSQVAGYADILVVSDLRMGNVLHKAITYFANKKVASIIMGALTPVIMTSRSDTIADKVLAVALSSYVANI